MVSPIENFTLIFGAMKCGTTSLFAYLAEHPQVAACKAKEPNFFTHEKSWKKGMPYYQSLWDYDSKTHAIAMEASINYSKIPSLPNAAERICSLAQDNSLRFKLIYLIRNPVERIISHCTHDLEEQWSIRYKQPIVHGIPYPAIEISKYAMQLDEYFQRFDQKDILLINADDLKKEPQHILKQVCNFLEIDSDFEFSNLGKQHNTSTGKTITNKAWPVVNKYIASPVISYLPRQQREPVMQTVQSWFSTGRVQEKFRLSEQQYAFILEELKDDLIRLEQVYGIDTSIWKLDF